MTGNSKKRTVTRTRTNDSPADGQRLPHLTRSLVSHRIYRMSVSNCSSSASSGPSGQDIRLIERNAVESMCLIWGTDLVKMIYFQLVACFARATFCVDRASCTTYTK